MPRFDQPLDLNSDERALLEFLLTAEFPGRSELLDQAQHVQAVGDCDCGCGTIDLGVEGRVVPAQAHEGLVPVEAYGERNGVPLEVLLFVRGGLLSSLEIVDYSTDRPLAYPTPGELKLWLAPRTKPNG